MQEKKDKVSKMPAPWKGFDLGYLSPPQIYPPEIRINNHRGCTNAIQARDNILSSVTHL